MFSFPRFLSTLFVAALSTSLLLAQGLGTGQVEQLFDQLAAEQGGAPDAHVRLLTDNQDSWYARWYMMERAKKTIDITYFIVENDIFGRAMLGMLFKKAKEGVNIRLMVDARGTKTLARTWMGQDFLQELVALPNVRIKVYNPIGKALLRLPQDIRSAVASNHDKLMIVDGEWLVTGGRNISRHYFGHKDDEPHAYRDTDVLVQGGRAPEAARRAFEEEWDKTTNSEIGEDWFGNWVSRATDLELARRAMNSHMLGLDPVKDPELSSKFSKKLAFVQAELEPFKNLRGYQGYTPFRGERAYPLLLLDKHSLVKNTRNDISANLVRLCDAAEKEIIIQNPYVVLTRGAKDALQRASQRGVEIILNTNSPESTDSVLTQAMFVMEWKQLKADIPKLRIFALEGDNKLHAKVFVADRRIALVGTYNMDPLSEDINSENVALVKSSAFATMNYHRVQGEVDRSIEYTIRITGDGKIEQLVGPSDHVSKKVLDWVEKLGALAFLRPLI
jgi:cardiolipin synthase C